jgi:hypothetical protein
LKLIIARDLAKTTVEFHSNLRQSFAEKKPNRVRRNFYVLAARLSPMHPFLSIELTADTFPGSGRFRQLPHFNAGVPICSRSFDNDPSELHWRPTLAGQ